LSLSPTHRARCPRGSLLRGNDQEHSEGRGTLLFSNLKKVLHFLFQPLFLGLPGPPPSPHPTGYPWPWVCGCRLTPPPGALKRSLDRGPAKFRTSLHQFFPATGFSSTTASKVVAGKTLPGIAQKGPLPDPDARRPQDDWRSGASDSPQLLRIGGGDSGSAIVQTARPPFGSGPPPLPSPRK